MERYKKQFKESYAIDKAYIIKFLKAYKKGIDSFDSLIDNLIITLRIKNDKRKIEALKDYIEQSIDYTNNEKDFILLAQEILNEVYL